MANTQKTKSQKNERSKKAGGRAKAPELTSQDNTLSREIWGIVLIALGLIFAVILYFAVSTQFGKGFSALAFGVLGLLAYAFPVVLIGSGVLTIMSRGEKKYYRVIAWACVFLFALLALINVNSKHLIALKYIQYIKDAYKYSSMLHGLGGAVGALLAWPLKALVDIVCSDIILIAVMIICVLIITRISIRETVTKIKERAAQVRINRPSDYDDDMFDDSGDSHDNQGDDKLLVIHTPPIQKKRKNSSKNKDDGFTDLLVTDFDTDAVSNGKKVDTPPVLHADESDDDFDLNFDAVRDYDKKTNFLDKPVKKAKRPLDVTQAMADEAAAEFSPDVAPIDREELQPAAMIKADKLAMHADDCVVAASSEFGGLDTEYQRPPYTLLKYPVQAGNSGEKPEVMGKRLLAALNSFHINAQITSISVGPTITRFEVMPPQGVRVRKITELGDDLALAMAAGKALRFEAPIPGKSVIGIEVPNKTVSTVYLREILESAEFRASRAPLTFALGKDTTGKVMVADLSRMPHLLIAGRTGSGKSVCLNTILLSLIYHLSPEEMRLILIDPKVVEFRTYANLPHLLVPVVTEHQKAASALHWAVSEMERRNREMAKSGARNIARYNEIQANPDDRMPRIVVIIDELADLMMTSPKDVEDSIVRLSQLGRACGIHLIVATQRPSADIITPLIKANIPARIAFAVSDATNSRVILDTSGAERLVGNGDMLFHTAELPKALRIQCAFVSDDEVEKVAEFFQRTQPVVEFDETIDSQITAGVSATGKGGSTAASGDDNITNEELVAALRVFITTGRASTTMLQTRLRMGYSHAARLTTEMEDMGLISRLSGNNSSRKVLITVDEFNAKYGKDDPIVQEEGDYDD